MTAVGIQPFRLEVSELEQKRLIEKVRDAQLPDDEIVPDAGDDYGVSKKFMDEMVRYWLDDFSWPEKQQAINNLPQYTASLVDGEVIHFQHVRSDVDNAVPVLLIHGWPGSFYEFSQLVPLLTKPTEDRQQAFHCVIPSLPGFCYSSRPRRGQSLKVVASMFQRLMVRLGYQNFFIQAGDWGHWCARYICAQHPGSVLGAHFNWVPAPLPPLPEMRPGSCMAGMPPREFTIRQRVQAWLESHLAYAQYMRTRPSSLGYLLADSPIALLTFIGEKYVEASNPKNPLVQSNLWKDHILTTVCLYYFSRCAPTASLVYFENVRHENFPTECCKQENWIACPTGYTSFLYDTRPSLKWGVEKTANLVFYNERDNAGHFAALEEPVGLAEDLRAVVHLVMKGEAHVKVWPGEPDLTVR